MSAPSRLCGTCTACCRVFAVPEVSKPLDGWCAHCEPTKGCKIYDTRPTRCVEFQCLWLASQAQPGAVLSEKLRPDRCKVVFAPSTNPSIMTAVTLPGYPLAWMNKVVMTLIERFVKGGIAVAVGRPNADENLLIKPDGNVRRVKLSAPDENGMRWSEGEV